MLRKSGDCSTLGFAMTRRNCSSSAVCSAAAAPGLSPCISDVVVASPVVQPTPSDSADTTRRPRRSSEKVVRLLLRRSSSASTISSMYGAKTHILRKHSTHKEKRVGSRVVKRVTFFHRPTAACFLSSTRSDSSNQALPSISNQSLWSSITTVREAAVRSNSTRRSLASLALAAAS